MKKLECFAPFPSLNNLLYMNKSKMHDTLKWFVCWFVDDL